MTPHDQYVLDPPSCYPGTDDGTEDDDDDQLCTECGELKEDCRCKPTPTRPSGRNYAHSR